MLRSCSRIQPRPKIQLQIERCTFKKPFLFYFIFQNCSLLFKFVKNYIFSGAGRMVRSRSRVKIRPAPLLNRYPAGFPATSLLTVNTYQYRSCYAQHHLAGLNLFYKLLAESISWGKSVAFHPPLNLSKWSIFLELYSHCVAYVDAMMP